jgi:hypothetical protein
VAGRGTWARDAALAQIIHAAAWLALYGDWAAEWLVILGSGYNGGPARGPVAGGSTGPGFLLPCRGAGFALVRGRVAGQ